MSNRSPKPTSKPVVDTPGMMTRGRAKRTSGQVNSVVQNDPKNYREAKSSALWMQWQESTKEEIEALKTLGTFTMTMREPNITTLHSKWVYKIKVGRVWK
jgi:hypothetical protein